MRVLTENRLSEIGNKAAFESENKPEAKYIGIACKWKFNSERRMSRLTQTVTWGPVCKAEIQERLQVGANERPYRVLILGISLRTNQDWLRYY